ncbi:hypothetical protein [Mycolicibacterium vinylchloridicum]|uniref:hypothetical protein n=1 Tax=Mycolicibacterium vinylchloridicum TaxID=2736928 RepID=UPI0015CAFDBE|nr:hypothetical protein [Mycolicibacterium vinylchloridicum]
MSSDALARWRSERCSVLDSLEAIHEKVTEKKRGRQTATEHLNLALFVRLAAEFQGFCRDLHDDAALQISDSLSRTLTNQNPNLVPVLKSSLVRIRKLDSGNASPGNLGNDFAILGMTLWPDIYARYPTRGPKWNSVLDRLNDVRNAIAHSDAVKLQQIRATQPLTLATFREWRRSLNTAASGFDRVVAAYLTYLTGDTAWN